MVATLHGWLLAPVSGKANQRFIPNLNGRCKVKYGKAKDMFAM